MLSMMRIPIIINLRLFILITLTPDYQNPPSNWANLNFNDKFLATRPKKMTYAVIFRPILGSFNLYMIPSDGKKTFCH